MLELETIKQQCRLETDFDDDNELLELYSGAAKRYVERYTDRKLYATTSEAGYSEDPDALLLDDDITVAMLVYIGHRYAEREGEEKLPPAVNEILWHYRRLGL